MPRLMVEMRRSEDLASSIREILGALKKAGATPVEGHDPVPMGGSRGQSATVIVTVDVPDADATRRVESIPGVLQVYSDARIEPFS